MPLKMRSTGLGHGVYKDDVDYGVFCGEWCIGRIYRDAHRPRVAALVLGPARSQQAREHEDFQSGGNASRSPRPSLRQVGNNGRRGRSSKRSPDAASIRSP